MKNVHFERKDDLEPESRTVKRNFEIEKNDVWYK